MVGILFFSEFPEGSWAHHPWWLWFLMTGDWDIICLLIWQEIFQFSNITLNFQVLWFFFSWQIENILVSLREIGVYIRIVYSSWIFWRTPWVGVCPMRPPSSAALPGLPFPLLDAEYLNLCHSALSTPCYIYQILQAYLSSKSVWLEEAISHAYLSTKWVGKMRFAFCFGDPELMKQSSLNIRVPQSLLQYLLKCFLYNAFCISSAGPCLSLGPIMVYT